MRSKAMDGVFDHLAWREDSMLLDDLVFRLAWRVDQPFPPQLYRSGELELNEDCFLLCKDRSLVDQYAQFWTNNRFEADHILELGIWDGGSVAFWFEHFRPEKHVAIDLSRRGDSRYFQHYKESRGLEGRIKTYWGTDQADSSGLLKIIEEEFSGRLDLVIDDASHQYEATKASFEAIFPLVRLGGLYVIEDWSWPYHIDLLGPTHPLATATELTKLLVELLGATGSSTGLISRLTVFPSFVVIERGKLELASKGNFAIEDHISRRSRLFKLYARFRGRIRPVLRRPRRVLRQLLRNR